MFIFYNALSNSIGRINKFLFPKFKIMQVYKQYIIGNKLLAYPVIIYIYISTSCSFISWMRENTNGKGRRKWGSPGVHVWASLNFCKYLMLPYTCLQQPSFNMHNNWDYSLLARGPDCTPGLGTLDLNYDVLLEKQFVYA